MNFTVFAAGDSYNDLAMIEEADEGCLFRAPEAIRNAYTHLPNVNTHGELLVRIKQFLNVRES
jgi:phosphoserine/homoserine phosphotransferase